MRSERTGIQKRTKSVAWLALMAFSLSALSGCAGPRQQVQETATPEKRVPSKWEVNGIEVVRIKPAVDGLMLDLRYRVTDPKKARETIKHTTPITLIDQASGASLPIPNMAFVGKLRNLPNSGDAKTVYWIFFNNPGGLVKPGGKVTLVIGDVRIKDILVE